jgi:hypothetical protein
MKLRFAPGIIYRARSWTTCSVANAKGSATRNSSVASCYQPSSCLVDDNFYLGSVSRAVKCLGRVRADVASSFWQHSSRVLINRTRKSTDGRSPLAGLTAMIDPWLELVRGLFVTEEVNATKIANDTSHGWERHIVASIKSELMTPPDQGTCLPCMHTGLNSCRLWISTKAGPHLG